jgi:hypothetical protein
MRKLGTYCVAVVAALAASVPAANARPAEAPTISASTASVTFGNSVVLHGAIAGAAAGEEIEILSQACGFTAPVPIATVRTGAKGAYTFTLEPMLNSTLSVRASAAESRPTRVTVVPSIQLRRVGSRAFAVDVSAGNGATFAKPVALQQLNPRTKRWRTIATTKLAAPSDPGALIAVSSGTFRAAVKPGTNLRAYLGQAAAGECYKPGTSPPLRA